MILICWRDGAIDIARELPPGAVELVRGGQDMLLVWMQELREGLAQGDVLRMAGVSEAADDGIARDLLRRWMREQSRHPRAAYLRFNFALDANFVG